MAKQKFKEVLSKSDRKGKPEKVIKCSLSGFVNPEYKEEILQKIQELVLSVSKAVNKCSLAFNMLLLFCLKNKLKIPCLENHSIFYQCCLMGKNFKGALPDELKFIQDTYFKSFPTVKRVDNDTQAFSMIAKAYRVNFLNSLVFPFWGRMRRYVEYYILNVFKLPKRLVKSTTSYITGTSTTPVNLPDNVLVFADNERELLGFPVKIDEAWLKLNPLVVLNYYYHILSDAENYPDMRKFTIAPICKIKSHFISIDTKVFYGIVKNSFNIPETNFKAFEESKKEYWNEVFNLGRLKQNQLFTGTIQTDGVSVCIHYCEADKQKQPKKRGKKKIVQEKLVLEPEQRVIAIDPGRVNLIYGIEKLPNKKVKTFRLTRKSYYNSSGMTQANQRSKKWEKDIEVQEKIFAEVSLKTTNLDSWNKFLNNYLQVYDILWTEKTKRKWGQQRFRVYHLKQKTLDKFFASMRTKSTFADPKPQPVIGYGAAQFASTGKGEIAAPTSSLYKKCCQHFKTIPVDEFRTTRICCDCNSELWKVTQKKMVTKTKITEEVDELGILKFGVAKEDVEVDQEVRGLRWCCSTECRSFKNRDRNAALNILRCFTGVNRPENLDRNLCPVPLGDYEEFRLSKVGIKGSGSRMKK